MKRSPAEPTTAKTLEEKFDRGEEVLDYFDVPKARVTIPVPNAAATKQKASSSSPVRRDSPSIVVREEPAAYRENSIKKKRSK